MCLVSNSIFVFVKQLDHIVEIADVPADVERIVVSVFVFFVEYVVAQLCLEPSCVSRDGQIVMNTNKLANWNICRDFGQVVERSNRASPVIHVLSRTIVKSCEALQVNQIT